MAFGVYTGYPVPAAFATTGAMVGVGLSLGGDPAIDTYRRIALFWALVPPVSGGLAYLTATILRRDDIPETIGVPLLAAVVGGIIANVQLGVIPSPPEASQSSIAEFIARQVELPTVADVDPVVVLVTLAAAAAWFLLIRRRTNASVEGASGRSSSSSGASSPSPAAAVRSGWRPARLRTSTGPNSDYPVSSCSRSAQPAFSRVRGWGRPNCSKRLPVSTHSWVSGAIAALVPGFIIAQLAIALGIPISFNNIIISGVIGGGLAGGSAGVSRRKIGVTLVFWLITLGASIGIGFGLYKVFAAVLGG